jgi:hypothetical protein
MAYEGKPRSLKRARPFRPRDRPGLVPADFAGAVNELKDAIEAFRKDFDAREGVAQPEGASKAKGVSPAKLADDAAPKGVPDVNPLSNKNFDEKTSKTPIDTLVLLMVSGLMGMVGQGARTIVGLKKVSDAASTAPSEADTFRASRIFIGLMIGFVAGVGGGLTSKVFGAKELDAGLLFYLASIGYIGVDAIEGFANTIVGRKPDAPNFEPDEKPKDPGHDEPSNGGKTSRSRHNLKQNQIEAYNAAIAQGLSNNAALALVANMTGESLSKPDDVHPDPSHANPHQMAHGIVQWDDPRAERIREHFGDFPQNLSVADQTKAAIWEIRKFYPRTWAALQSDRSPKDIVAVLVEDFERPRDTSAATAFRDHALTQVAGLIGVSTTTA